MKPSDKHDRSQLYAVDLKWCNAAYCGKMNRKIWLRVLHYKETLNLIGLLIVLCKGRARNRLYRCWNFLLFWVCTVAWLI